MMEHIDCVLVKWHCLETSTDSTDLRLLIRTSSCGGMIQGKIRLHILSALLFCPERRQHLKMLCALMLELPRGRIFGNLALFSLNTLAWLLQCLTRLHNGRSTQRRGMRTVVGSWSCHLTLTRLMMRSQLSVITSDRRFWLCRSRKSELVDRRLR